MPDNHSRSSARNLTTLLSFSQCARIVCLVIAFLGKCVGVVFIQKPSHGNLHNPVLLWRQELRTAGDCCRLRITLFQIHSLWLSLGSWPTWEIIRHLLQPRWCEYRCGPLVRAQTKSQARWVKAVSQMPDNHSRSSARNLTTLLSFSQCARIVCLAIAFLGKCAGVTFI